MSYTGVQRAPEITPGGRVTRMSALEATSSSHPGSSPIGGGYNGSSDEYHDTPESNRSLGMAMMQKRDASLSSHSHAPNDSSPEADFSTPEGVASAQSEQLGFFKDYYSQDEIRPNDVVATLWAYQPRANDEFELERGDMLKVVGIWDDGWATGVRVRERAEEWEARRRENRDSGVSNGSNRPRPPSPTATDGEIKAFPVSFDLAVACAATFTNNLYSLSVYAYHNTGEKQSKAMPPKQAHQQAQYSRHRHRRLKTPLPALLDNLNFPS